MDSARPGRRIAVRDSGLRSKRRRLRQRRPLQNRRTEIEAFCRQYSVLRLELFGSAAAGEYRSNSSDLDFLVEFEPQSPAGYADRYFGLLEALEQLFKRPVDLVVASAIRNPYFRESVDNNKALLYAA